jgi:penicillin-binding protein-related factor A (putative recombinase)
MNDTTRQLNRHLLGSTAPRDVDAPVCRTNRNNDGRGFQKEIEITCGAYQSRRVATIRKVDPPTRVVGSGSARHVIFVANPWLDFAGSWTANNGRAIFFEAKSTATHRLKLGEGGLTETQQAALATWKHANALTFVLWQWSGRVALFTPEQVAAAVARGDRSLVHESGENVRRGTGSVVWDFLFAIPGV